jgi:drug/metabolite transporter (DMT)-like permease
MVKSFLPLALYVLTTSAGLIVIKLSTSGGFPVAYVNDKIQLNFNLLSILGVFLYGLSFILYFYLISKFDLGYIIPLTTALVYILIFIASFLIFHESFTIAKIVGISLIVAGLIFLNTSK